MASKKILIPIIILLMILLIGIISVIFISFNQGNPANSNQNDKDNNSLTEYEKLNSNIDEEVYIALYVGDLDGEVSEDWFSFYNKLTNFYQENKIPVVFSFYPESIKDDVIFDNIFLRMYLTPNIELMQKGYSGGELEYKMDTLSFAEQREIIKKGQDHFIEKMQELTNSKDIKIPVLYNQIGSRFTEDTKEAAESLGFKFYFDVYLGDGLEPVNSSDTFDVTQYGVPFTKTGDAGREQKFKTPQEIFNEIDTLERDDVPMITINGKRFIPIWAHQQDFEDTRVDDKLDEYKWKTYVQVVEALNRDSNVHLISPMDAYEMRR